MSFTISLPSDAHDATIQARIDSKTKPPGALGMLEHLAFQAARASATSIRPVFCWSAP